MGILVGRPLERHAAAVAGIRQGGRCRFMINCVIYGPHKHPFARIISDTIRLWCRTLEQIAIADSRLLADIKVAWALAKG